MPCAAAFCGVAITAGLAYSAVSVTVANYRIAAKEGLRYTAERAEAGAVQVGICEVTIPRSHQTGELEAPSMLRLEVAEKADRHVILRKTERLEDQKFYDELRARVERSPRKELFVFVHGFNVPFEDAARRTAQMAYDLKYQGAPVFFSWPANDKLLLTYAKDETNVAWAAPHLKQFLLDVVHHTDAQSINLIAHSMGNRALTAALRDLSLELRDESRLFNQVVLAAPDIDADDFKLNIAPAISRTANRVTVYASSHDQALAASQMVHQYPRAGDSIVLVPGIDTIDVSAIDGGPWGHSYYGSSDPILQDIGQLLLATPTADRQWLTSSQQNGMTYWVLRTETATTSSQIPYR
jgi:esterase/lipase superfamily enzyme